MNRKYPGPKIIFVLLLGLVSIGTACKSDRAQPPNIIVFLADDMGFSDIGSYGAEIIETPNLDQLAAEGKRFPQFYNAARCSPTRASLLTGKYPHQAGMGWLAGPNTGYSAYQGYLNESKTIAEALRDEGYQTMMTGKWHVGNPQNGVTPWTKGFNRYFGIPTGANYWDPEGLKLDGESFEWSGDDYFKTEALAKYATNFIAEHNKENPEQPYFLYHAFSAPHWPLHARENDIEKYRGKFMLGWDELRKRRFENMITEGVIDSGQTLPPKDPAVPDWESLSMEKQWAWDQQMSVYAAQVAAMDRAVGRVLEQVKKEGESDNTLVLFLSDNGASPEAIGFHRSRIRNDEGIKPGGPNSYQAYFMPWANLSNTPFRLYKHWAHEGGIATPFIAKWPNVIKDKGSMTDVVGHVMDIMPTALDVASIGSDEESGTPDSLAMEGQSLLPVFKNEKSQLNRRIFWEHEGHKAVREGKWKLVSAHSFDDWFFKKWGFPRNPSSEWELYNIKEDRFEQNDLADSHPQKRDQLIEAYQKWAERVGIVDWNKVRPEIPLFNQ